MKPLTAIALTIAVAGCAATGEKLPPLGEPQQPVHLAWPAPPLAARVTYLYSFRGPTDLGYRESFGNTFRDFLGGGKFQGMVRPYAVAANDFMLVVADPGLSAVHVFDQRRKRYTLLDSADKKALGSPVGVALGADRIYIADSGVGRVFVLDARQQLVREIDGFERPTGLAFDPAGERLYVADTHAHRIRQYDRDGQYLGQIGERGDSDGQFNFPTHLAIEGGRLLVNDTLNFRVQMFELATGRHLGSLGEHGDQEGYFAQPKGIGASADGNLFVAEAVFGRVQIFDPQGRLLLAFGSPGAGPGQFQLPAGVALWNDRIYVADSGNRRIQVFEYADRD